MKKRLALMICLLAVLATEAYAERLPVVGSDSNNWGNVMNKYLLVPHTGNGTLKQDLNGTFYNLNVSNNLAVIGNIYGELPDSFKLWNFTNAYGSRNDRFVLSNFTAAYDSRADRFGNLNFTALLPPYPTNATIQIGTSQVTGLGSLALLDSLADNSINSSMIQSGAITGPKLGANAVTTGKISPDTIKDSDINPAAGILLSKLAYGTSGQIIAVNSSGAPNYITLSGDATLSSAGVLTVNGNTITNSQLAGSIDDSKLNAISTSNKVSGSAIQLAPSSGLEDSGGLRIRLDGSTLSLSSSGLRVADSPALTGLILSGLSASQVVGTDGSRNMVSLGTTGSGNVVLASSPSLTTPDIGAATATSIAVGNGTAVTKHISATAGNVSTAEIEEQECGDLATVTVTGASVGDTVIASPAAVSNGIETKDLMWNAVVSAPNTVKIRACNPTDDDINILNTQSWRIDIWQH